MSKIIATSFAYLDGYNSSVNVKKRANKIKLYLKNALVTLYYAKIMNPDCEVALVTNIKENNIFSAFEENGIKVIFQEFNSFLMPKDYKWSLAFYKFCALRRVQSLGYDFVCFIDNDVISLKKYDLIWENAQNNICAINLFEDYNESVEFPHVGGEFLAFSNNQLSSFLVEIEKIYRKVIVEKIYENTGDEYFTSIALNKLQIFCFLNDYVFRCWTGTTRVVPSKKQLDSIICLHVPAEKQYGMVKLSNFIMNGKKVKFDKMISVLHVFKPSILTKMKIILKKVIGNN